MTYAVTDSLPANATAIERYVDDHIHNAYDFQTYGAVWYLPTPSDVLKAQQGEYKSKAVLLASLLEAKQIPHAVEVSPVHFGSITAAKHEPTLPSNTQQLGLPSLKMANSSPQTRRMCYSL